MTLSAEGLVFPAVGLDESGNTGEDLLNEAQPVYVLASVRLEEDEAKGIVSRLGSAEAKFSRIKKSPKLQHELLDILSEFTPQMAKAVAVHKRYMVVAKMVDDLVQPLGEATGVNIYDLGAHHALTEVWFHTLPVLCREKSWNELLSRFVRMCRAPRQDAAQSFYAHIRYMIDQRHCGEPGPDELWFLLATEEALDLPLLAALPKGGLDPAITVLVSLAIEWGNELQHPYWMVHDEAAVVARWHPYLDGMFFTSAQPKTIGAGRRSYELPLKVAGLRLVDSKSFYPVQVADLVAGAICYALSGQVRREVSDLRTAIEETGILDLLVYRVWPTGEIEPDEEWPIGLDPHGEVAAFVAENATRRRGE